MGSLNSELYILTNIFSFRAGMDDNQNELLLDPQKVNEIMLSELDKAGAKNITTLQEEYTTPSGIKGIKVYGKMTIPDEVGRPMNASYELYSFTENNALQQLLITHINDINADELTKRIVNSITFKN